MGGLFSADAWETVWRYRSTFLHGLGNTVQLAVFALLLSLMLGILFGLMSAGGKKALRAAARIYVEFIQNTPLLLQMCFLYYAPCVFRKQYRNSEDRNDCAGRIPRGLHV